MIDVDHELWWLTRTVLLVAFTAAYVYWLVTVLQIPLVWPWEPLP